MADTAKEIRRNDMVMTTLSVTSELGDQLCYHKQELRSALTKITQKIAKLRPGFRDKKFPLRFAKLYWHALRGEEISSNLLTSDWQGGASLRTVHDFYGWMAKDTAETLGLCSGALYRTYRYLKMSPSDRNGRRGAQTVHIEHTVPVNVLFRALKHEVYQFESPATLHDYLIRHSVCTAFHFQEKTAVVSNQSPAFAEDGRRIGNLPFLRYIDVAKRDKDFRVFNIVTGEEIEISKFTFDDHARTLLEASRLILPDSCGIGIYSLGLFNEVEPVE